MPQTLSTVFGDILSLNELFDENIDEYVKELVGEEVFSALREICENPRFDSAFMMEEDALTRVLYEKDEMGFLIFPSVPDWELEPIHSFLGDQLSAFHNEPADDHSDFTAGNLVVIGEEDGIAPRIAALIGTWHDVAKKYTAHTGPHGMSFYGHAQLSAYIALHWLKKVSTISADEKAAIVAAIYGHDIIKLGSKESRDKYIGYLDCLSNKINRLNTRYCEALIQADCSIDEFRSDGWVEYTVVKFCPDDNINPYHYEGKTLSKKEYEAIMTLGRNTMQPFLAEPAAA